MIETLDAVVEARLLELSDSASFQQNPCFYLYDCSSIRDNLNLLRKSLPSNISVFYAMKANPHRRILEVIKQHGYCSGIEIASAGELDVALSYFDGKGIIYTGPGKTDYELRQAILRGIRLVNIESLSEAVRLNSLCEDTGVHKQDVLLRINTNFEIDCTSGKMSGKSTKFGFDEKDVVSAVKYIAQNLKHITIKGYHVFGASGVLNHKLLNEHNAYSFALLKQIEKETGIPLQTIDLGGGFGVDYRGEGTSFDATSYSEDIMKLMKHYGYIDRQIILELGRFVVASSGYYCTQVIDIKSCKGKKYVIVAGGVNHLNRPAVTGENQPILVIPKNNAPLYEHQEKVRDECVDIAGPLCFAEDKIGKNVQLKSVDIGDLIVVTLAGAYGLSASQINFLSHEKPAEHFI